MTVQEVAVVDRVVQDSIRVVVSSKAGGSHWQILDCLRQNCCRGSYGPEEAELEGQGLGRTARTRITTLEVTTEQSAVGACLECFS